MTSSRSLRGHDVAFLGSAGLLIAVGGWLLRRTLASRVPALTRPPVVTDAVVATDVGAILGVGLLFIGAGLALATYATWPAWRPLRCWIAGRFRGREDYRAWQRLEFRATRSGRAWDHPPTRVL